LLLLYWQTYVITFLLQVKLIGYFRVLLYTSRIGSMNNDFRCDCPITSAIDIVGDKWTLVIIKQMLLEGKKTFKALSESDEAIATNILSSRLKALEKLKMIRKEKVPHNRKTNHYLLTEKGLGLTPTIVELTLWSDSNIRADHASLTWDPRLNILKTNKEEAIKMLVETYKSKNWPSNPSTAAEPVDNAKDTVHTEVTRRGSQSQMN